MALVSFLFTVDWLLMVELIRYFRSLLNLHVTYSAFETMLKLFLQLLNSFRYIFKKKLVFNLYFQRVIFNFASNSVCFLVVLVTDDDDDDDGDDDEL